MKITMLNKTWKMKYKEYGNIYLDCCLKCIKEGTPYCRLEYKEENVCVNFESLEDLKRKL